MQRDILFSGVLQIYCVVMECARKLRQSIGRCDQKCIHLYDFKMFLCGKLRRFIFRTSSAFESYWLAYSNRPEAFGFGTEIY